MEVSLALGRKAIAAAAVLVVLIVVLLAWTAGEAHYRNCITAAEVRHPIAESELETRTEAIDGCSRWP